MPRILPMSLLEIQNEISEEIHSLEDSLIREPSRKWPAPLLILMREFHDLATAPHLDPGQIRDFTHRLTQHIATARLKGFDHLIWYAQTLEHLATPPTGNHLP